MIRHMPDIAQIKRIFEAALLGAGQPLSVPQLAALFEEDTPPHEDIARALEELKESLKLEPQTGEPEPALLS